MLLLCACERSTREEDAWEGPGPKHLALIVLDTLRADHLGLYGYERPTSPNLDALGKRAVVFDHAFATSSCTLESVISLFTGTAAMVNPNKLPALTPMQTLFRKAGFVTHAVVANPWLLSRPALFEEGFDHFWNATRWTSNSTKAVADMARQQIERSATSGRRSFFYFHFLDPHDPYRAPERVGFYDGVPMTRPLVLHEIAGEEEVKRRFEATGWRGKPTPAHLAPDELRFLEAEYDEEIRYLDKQLAHVIEAFETHGMLEDTLIVITADHGEGFMDHGLLKHGFQLYDELVHVPLIMLWPRGLKPERRAALASGVDLPTTLLAAASIDIPDQFCGFDLLANGRKDAPVPLRTHFINQQQFGFRSLHHKWIHDRMSGAIELYDVTADPGEHAPIGAPEALTAQLPIWRAVQAHHALATEGQAAPAPLVADEVKKQLEALGYLVE